MFKNENKLDEISVVDQRWDITSIIEYIRAHGIKILMFLAVFVIIYAVDRIVHFNSIIYGANQVIPGLPGSTIVQNNQVKHLKKPRKSAK